MALPSHIRPVQNSDVKTESADSQNAKAPLGPTRIPDPPDELCKEAQPYWGHYAEQLIQIGAFAEPDTQALAMLANVTEEYWRADGRERAIKATDQNNVRWTAISHKRSVEKQMKTMLDSFGLTPAARIKIRAS